MNPTRLFCGILCLFLLFGCGFGCGRPGTEDRPPVHVTYTPDPTVVPENSLPSTAQPVSVVVSEITAAPTDRSASTAAAVVTPAPGAKAAAFLYAGESSNYYRGYRKGRPGICVEQLQWAPSQNMLYQELPGTEGLSELIVTGIEAKPDGQLPKAYVYVRYLDNAKRERIVCFDYYGGDGGVCYPVSAEPAMELTESQQQMFNDLMLIGYFYEDYQRFKDSLPDPESWERYCQRRILDALYFNYDDALPPYLTGEGTLQSNPKTAVISQAELEAFFQSVVNRPCLVPDRCYIEYEEIGYEDEDWWTVETSLPPGQVPLPSTDTYGYAEVKQAVLQPDGIIRLYGYVGLGELFYNSILSCRIRPAEGFLGYCIESTEMCPVMTANNDPLITFAP